MMPPFSESNPEVEKQSGMDMRRTGVHRTASRNATPHTKGTNRPWRSIIMINIDFCGNTQLRGRDITSPGLKTNPNNIRRREQYTKVLL
jgi:hypothetical protein